MRFVVDAQLPPALARWLEAQGHEAEHVADVKLAAAPDTVIWERAAVLKAVIITKDADFALRRSMESGSIPAIVWLRVGNTRRTTLLRWIESLMPQIVVALERGETLIEIE